MRSKVVVSSAAYLIVRRRRVSCCHCLNCKKYTGTIFTTNVVFPAGVSSSPRSAKSISYSNTHHNKSYRIINGEKLIAVYHDEAQDSGNPLARHFCSQCGSPLFNTNGDFGRTMAVFYGALEGFEHKAPEVEYYAKDRVEWLPEFSNTEKAQTKPGRD